MRPIAEKLAMLEMLKDRELVIRKSRDRFKRKSGLKSK